MFVCVSPVDRDDCDYSEIVERMRAVGEAVGRRWWK